MAPKFLAFILLHFISSVTGHNITNILAQFPEYSAYNSLLSETRMADQINTHRTITVLVAGNSSASAISNQPAYVLKRILAVHVLLDYYDKNKLSRIVNTSVSVATLFSTTGHSTGKNGYLNLSDSGGNVISVESSEPGGIHEAHIMKVVVTQPQNISVLEISKLIIPRNIGSNTTAPPSPPGAADPPHADGPADAPPDAKPSSANRQSAVTRRVAALVGLAAAFWVAL